MADAIGMTILLGFVTADFSLLGADTRASMRGPGGSLFVDDDTPKIFRSGIGLVAGAGWFDLVRAAIDRLKTPIGSSPELALALQAVREETGIASEDPLVSLTCWLVTYSVGPSREVGLAWCSSSANYFPRPVKTPGYFLVAPSGMSDAQENALHRVLAKYLTPPADLTSALARQSYFLQIMQQTIKAAAQMCDSVSARFQFGLHERSGLGVSSLLEDVDRGVDWT